MAYLGPRIWKLPPNNLKGLELVEALKSEIKTGYLKPAHAEFVNDISTNWGLYKFISVGFNLLIKFVSIRL